MSAAGVEDVYELSPLQQGMLLHATHDGAVDMYLSQQTYMSEGDLDTQALVTAWHAAARAHPALRTSFHWEGLDRPLQVVHRDVVPPVNHIDWSDLDETDERERLASLHRKDRERGFDPTVAPLQRLHLVRLSGARHCILWTYHHLLMDGWSVPVVMADVLAHYRRVTVGGPAPRPAPPFRDYVAWLQAQDPGATRRFWAEYLGGARPDRIAVMQPWDPRRGTGAVERRLVSVPTERADDLRRTAARHRVTFGTIAQASWALVLRCYTGSDDVTFGGATSGRPAELRDADRIVGMLANTLPVRIAVPAGGDLGDWLRGIQDRHAAMRRYEFTPLADVKRWAGVPGRRLFESLLVLENYGSSVDAVDVTEQVRFRREALYDKISFPLTITMATDPVPEMQLLVHRERFEDGFVDDVLTRLDRVLTALVSACDVADVVAAAGPVLASATTAPAIGVPDTTEPGASGPPGAPVDAALEAAVAAVFAEVLDLPEVDVTRSFFDLGGDSFAAVRVIGRLEGAGLGMLAAHPSARQLAAALAGAAGEAGRTEAAGGTDATGDAADGAPGRRTVPPLVPVTRAPEMACAFQQEALWFMHRLDPHSTTYHVPFPLRIRGPLDVAALERALGALVARHEALRTRFVERDGVPVQVIDPPPARLELPVTALRRHEVAAWAARECDRPFDLARGPVLRASLARIGRHDHAVVIVAHHIVADGWSSRIVAGELSALYAAETDGRHLDLPELPLQPVDHAAWQRRRFTEGDDAGLEHWRRTLAGVPTLDFPTDRPRPAVPTLRGSTVATRIRPREAAGVLDHVRTHRVSLLAVLDAALVTVLQRYTGQDDIAVGSLFWGRSRADMEPLVGYLGNTVVLRTDAGGDPTFEEVVARCQATVMAATDHQDVPFALVVDALQPPRIAGRTPLFQIGLTLLPGGIADGLSLGRLPARSIPVRERYAAFDISVDVAESATGALDISMEYSTDLFDGERIRRFLTHYVTALTNGVAAPATPLRDVGIVPVAQWRRTRRRTGRPPVPTTVRRAPAAPSGQADRSLPEQVAAHARRHPHRVAVTTPDGRSLTYGELDRAADGVARALLRRGVARGSRIGVGLPPGGDLATVVIGAWRAGAACIPLDPALPGPAVSAAVAAAAPDVVVVTDAARASGWDVPGGADAGKPAVLTPESFVTCTADTPRPTPIARPAAVTPAWWINSAAASPRAVVLDHRALAVDVAGMQATAPLDGRDRVLLRGPLSSGAALVELLWPLAAGATAVAVPASTPTRALLGRHGITVVHATPTEMDGDLAAGPGLPADGLRVVVSHSEPLGAATLERMRLAHPRALVMDRFATAETLGVTVTVRRAGALADGRGGRVLPGVHARVLDRHLRPTPIGVPGRLFVAGPAIGLGRADDPAGTALAFVPDVLGDRAGARMVDTGDLACWDADGTLVHLGRADAQIRPAGHRVDRSVVADAVSRAPGVLRCAVTPGPGDRFLAYVVVDEKADVSGLRRHLTEVLAAFTVPDVVVVPDLPVAPTGRLDTTKLPPPSNVVPAAPTTPTQLWLAGVWQEFLGVRPGPQDGFFDLGANSLDVTRLIARIRRDTGVQLAPLEILRHPCLDVLAARIDGERPRVPRPDPPR